MVPIFILFWVSHPARGKQFLGWIPKLPGHGCRQLSGEYNLKSAHAAPLIDPAMGSSTG